LLEVADNDGHPNPQEFTKGEVTPRLGGEPRLHAPLIQSIDQQSHRAIDWSRRIWCDARM